MAETMVLIVGAGPSGLATSACLSQHSIPHLILEKEDCHTSLWKKRTYDRVNLHLAKEFCSLPLFPPPPKASTFMSKTEFLDYIDSYVSHHGIDPRFCRTVELASFDRINKKWRVEAKNRIGGKVEVYISEFLVVATGENNAAYIPGLPGLDSFPGEILHSSQYKSGSKYKGKDVLVIGCGNSGMEISYDLSNYEARCSIVIRSPFHVLTKEMVHRGMVMLKYLPVSVVDSVVLMLAKYKYGDLSQYGMVRPKTGPFYLKAITGRSPVIDVGTVQRIRDQQIQVVPEILNINKKKVTFENNVEKEFAAIIFATGYRSLTNSWLKDFDYVLNEDGMPKKSFPDHWKGENGLYCAGLARRGLFGVAMDAKAIANDISSLNALKN